MKRLNAKFLADAARKHIMATHGGAWKRSDTRTPPVDPVELHRKGDFVDPQKARKSMVGLINFLDTYKGQDKNTILAAYMIIFDDCISKFNASHWRVVALYVKSYADLLRKKQRDQPKGFRPGLLQPILKLFASVSPQTNAPRYLMHWVTAMLEVPVDSAKTSKTYKMLQFYIGNGEVPMMLRCRVAGAFVCAHLVYLINTLPDETTVFICAMMTFMNSCNHWEIVQGGDFLECKSGTRRLAINLHTGKLCNFLVIHRQMCRLTTKSNHGDPVENIVKDQLDFLRKPSTMTQIKTETDDLMRKIKRDKPKRPSENDIWESVMYEMNPIAGLRGKTCSVCLEELEPHSHYHKFHEFLQDMPMVLCDGIHPVHIKCLSKMNGPVQCPFRCTLKRPRVAVTDHEDWAARRAKCIRKFYKS